MIQPQGIGEVVLLSIEIIEYKEAADFEAYLASSTLVSLDIETTGLGKSDTITCAALYNGQHVAFVRGENLSLLKLLLNKPLKTAIHKADFDLKMLAWAGINLLNIDYVDTIILGYMRNEEQPLTLTYLSELYLGIKLKKGLAKEGIREVTQEVINYNALDAVATYHLAQHFLTQLDNPALSKLMHDTQRVHLNTSIHGVKVDLQYLTGLGETCKKGIDELIPVIRAQAPIEIERVEMRLLKKAQDKVKTEKAKASRKKPEFNFSSSAQLKMLLFEELQLPVQKNEKTRQVSTDDAALEKLEDKHAIILHLRALREKEKVYNTYVLGLLDKLTDGRIYPCFNVCGTETGRLAHHDPNVAQMPKTGGIRKLLMPDDGYVFISADFKSLEVVVSAYLTQDVNLLRMVREGISQHDITSESLGIPRDQAKTINFAMQYRCTHYRIQKILNCNEEKALEVFNKYWETFSGQKKMMDLCARKISRGEHIVNAYGRKRRFVNINRNPKDKGRVERQAWNAYIQSTGSDITSSAFVAVNQALLEKNYGTGLFTVHDEILIHVKKEFYKEAENILLTKMREAGLAIGIPVDAESSGPMEAWED